MGILQPVDAAPDRVLGHEAEPLRTLTVRRAQLLQCLDRVVCVVGGLAVAHGIVIVIGRVRVLPAHLPQVIGARQVLPRSLCVELGSTRAVRREIRRRQFQLDALDLHQWTSVSAAAFSSSSCRMRIVILADSSARVRRATFCTASAYRRATSASPSLEGGGVGVGTMGCAIGVTVGGTGSGCGGAVLGAGGGAVFDSLRGGWALALAYRSWKPGLGSGNSMISGRALAIL